MVEDRRVIKINRVDICDTSKNIILIEFPSSPVKILTEKSSHSECLCYLEIFSENIRF